MMAAFVARRVLTTFKNVSSGRCLTGIKVPKRQFCFSRCLTSRMYTEKHEWIVIKDAVGTVGISNHAQEQLGEIVYVETPEIGLELQTDDVAGCLESVKAASDVYSPVAGTVTEVNESLSSNPGLVNQQPLDEGWLYKMKVAADCDTSALMSDEEYAKYIEDLEH